MGIHNALYKSLAFGVSAMFTGVAGASARSPSSSSPPTASACSFRSSFSSASWWRPRLDQRGSLRRPVHPVHPEHRRRDLEGRPWAIFGVFMIGFVYLMPTGVAGAVRLLWTRRRSHENQARLPRSDAGSVRLPPPPKRSTTRAPPIPRSRSATPTLHGPASAYGTIGKTIDAYFRMVNDQGGINGRKVTFVSYDDGYSPPGRSRWRASWSSRPGAVPVPDARARLRIPPSTST